MNKIYIIFIACIIGCTNDQPYQKFGKAEKAHVVTPKKNNEKEKILIDKESSVVEWKGTKLSGMGSHSGTVKFKNGHLLFSEGKLAGGEVMVDMQSIYNTDIPLSDPVPRKNLTMHLNSDFETDIFTVSTFEIVTVTQKDDIYQVVGNLSIKNITQPITINIKEVETRRKFISEFTFDRFEWDIGKNGTWLERKLVDAEVHLKVMITLQDN